MKRRLLNCVLFIVLVSTVLGCKAKPSPSPSVSPLTSPLSAPQSLVPTPVPPSRPEEDEIRPFQIDKPIPVGATRVTGSGPAGVPVVLLDITFNGAFLTSGVIDRQGRFELELAQPLEARHRVGLALGNLAGTQWGPTDFRDERYYGDEAFNVPQIGFFFDTCMIRE